jgi:hypothetical protein
MRIWPFMLFFIAPLALSAELSSLQGHYQLKAAKGAQAKSCQEDGQLIYVAKENVVSFAEKITFVHINEGQVKEQVPEGCHYTYNTTYKDQKLKQHTFIRHCPEGELTVIQELWKDEQGLHYKVEEQKKGKSKITFCDYTLTKVGE